MITTSLNVVLCRIGAVILFVQAAENVGAVVPQMVMFSGSLNTATAYMGMMLATPLVGGILLWIYGGKLARKRKEPSMDSIHSVQSSDLVIVGTFVLGLYALLLGITSAAYTELMLLSQSDHAANNPQISSQYFAMRVSYLIQIGMGVLLVLGRRFIGRVFPVSPS